MPLVRTHGRVCDEAQGRHKLRERFPYGSGRNTGRELLPEPGVLPAAQPINPTSACAAIMLIEFSLDTALLDLAGNKASTLSLLLSSMRTL